MTAARLLELFDYTHEVNQAFLDELAAAETALPEASQQMAHLLLAPARWLHRLGWREAAPSSGWEELSLEQMRALNDEVHSIIRELLQRPDAEEQLRQRITYSLDGETSYANDLFEILFTLVNHATHHRAQVARMLREAGRTPPRSDYFWYCKRPV